MWVSDDVAAVLKQFQQQPWVFFMKTGASMGCLPQFLITSTLSLKRILILVSFE
jgi:hypothetical protein